MFGEDFSIRRISDDVISQLVSQVIYDGSPHVIILVYYATHY